MSEAWEVRSLLAGTFFSSNVLSIWVPGHSSVPGTFIFHLFFFDHNDGILPHIMGVWSVHSFLYMDIVLSLVIAFYFATVMASYSILGFYPGVCAFFQVLIEIDLSNLWLCSGLRIGPQLMDGLSAGRSPPWRQRQRQKARPDFIIAPNLRMLNTSDFSLVDHWILAMLQEWVCQHPMQDADKLKPRLIDRPSDRRSLIKRLIGDASGQWHESRPEVDILYIFHNPMLYYCTVLLVHTFSYFTWCWTNTPRHFENSARQNVGYSSYYYSQIGSCIWAFHWHWMTLKGIMAIILRHITGRLFQST